MISTSPGRPPLIAAARVGGPMTLRNSSTLHVWVGDFAPWTSEQIRAILKPVVRSVSLAP